MKPLIATTDWSAAIQAIHAAEHIVLTTHRTPDGDGIGSQIGLYHALKGLGKRISMHNLDGVPRIYRFLDGADLVVRGEWPEGAQSPDVIISLDCGSKSRLGMRDVFFADAALINLDHHASNDRFGDINIIDDRYCATGAMIFDLLIAMHLPLSVESARGIYTAVVTDTSNFRLASATADVYRLAADLVAAGAEPWPINMHIYESHRLAGLKLLSECLQTLEMRDDGQSAWVFVTREMFERTGADVEDTEGLIDYARSIEGVEVAVFIRNDDSDNLWKVSFRGKTHANVGALAVSLGGGGHCHAAGCMMRGTFEEVSSRVQKAVSELFV